MSSNKALACHIAEETFIFMRDRIMKNMDDARIVFQTKDEGLEFTKALVRLYSSIKTIESFVERGVTEMGKIHKANGDSQSHIEEMKAIARDETEFINNRFDEITDFVDGLTSNNGGDA